MQSSHKSFEAFLRAIRAAGRRQGQRGPVDLYFCAYLAIFGCSICRARVGQYNNIASRRTKLLPMQKEVKEEQAGGAEMGRSLACNHSQEDFLSPRALAPPAEQPPPKLQEGARGSLAGRGGAGRKGSVYHNFQKHLVTTLRLHVNLGGQRRGGDAGEQLAGSLWEYFIKSSRPTKRFLYSLLMNIPQNIIQLKNKEQHQQFHEHFRQLLARTAPNHLRHAQQQLRYQLLQQARKIVQDGHLDSRRMLKIQEFKDYFNRFILDLQKGQLNLRLPKHSKAKRADTQQQQLRKEDNSEQEE